MKKITLSLLLILGLSASFAKTVVVYIINPKFTVGQPEGVSSFVLSVSNKTLKVGDLNKIQIQPIVQITKENEDAITFHTGQAVYNELGLGTDNPIVIPESKYELESSIWHYDIYGFRVTTTPGSVIKTQGSKVLTYVVLDQETAQYFIIN